MVEVRRTRGLHDGHLAGVDQVEVDLVADRRAAHPEHAVLGVQDDALLEVEVVGDQRGLADAEVDERTRRDVVGDQLRDLVLRQRSLLAAASS